MQIFPQFEKGKQKVKTPRDFLNSVGVDTDKIAFRDSNVDEVIVTEKEITFAMYGGETELTFKIDTLDNGLLVNVLDIVSSNAPFEIWMSKGPSHTKRLETKVDGKYEGTIERRILYISDAYYGTNQPDMIHLAELFREIVTTY
jgi:hypothetical protein